MISSAVIILSSVFAGIAFLLKNYTEYEITDIFVSNPIYPILMVTLLVAVTVCMFAVHFWWRHSTTAQYKQRIQERNNEELLAEIQLKDKRIKELTASNEFLSKAIHRDNKLIPAMYNALSDFLSDSDDVVTARAGNKGTNLLAELSEIMQERKDMIIKIQKDYKSLPSTGIERVDNILNYMMQKASEKEIQFDFVLDGSVKEIAESVITKSALETLLADLIENAIIAVAQSDCKKVLVTMGIVNSCLEITVNDSGIPFDAEVLSNLGKIKSTTHADTGGSGIGYMTIFEILRECKASLVISEPAPMPFSFTKSVKVVFDGKGEFVVK